ncbi:fatty acyl-AMP ligase [Yunchengibacter salinarum]|uniref:fatty acyl-AMP ligase n=1 Tax=Yunchengibacter salinarum TaxID=3133399 RepID=UPI0035B5C0D7
MTDTPTITPTNDATLPRRFSDFDTLVDALEYAARGQRGTNFYNARGDLVDSRTWAQLRDSAEMLGRKLTGLGFRKGDRLALIAETNVAFVETFLGCQYAGVLPVPLPLPTSFGGKEGYVSQLTAQLTSCGARGVVGPDFMADIIKQTADGLDIAFSGSRFDLEQATDASGGLAKLTADDLTYLQYSSGSTRFPHGISITHRSLIANTFGMGYHGVQMQDGDRCVSWLPFYHDMGLVGTFLTTLTNQVSVDFIPTEEFARRPLSWLRVITANRGTISYSPTFGYDICTRRAALRAKALDELDLTTWRVAGIGGDMIRPDVLRGFHDTFSAIGFDDRAFLPSYGLAECTLGVSFGKAGRGVEIDQKEEALLSGEQDSAASGDSQRMREVVNCGTPLPEFDVAIRTEDGETLGEGGVGKVYLRGTSVMRDYFNDPDATRAVLSDDGWLDTGDMGYLKDGDLFIVGRAKDMIIVNGRNHWPQDIEWAAEQMPGVRPGDVAAISIPGENREEVPLILAHCGMTDSNERARFIDEMKRLVQKETGIICMIELVPPRSLPRTSSGKLSRSKARTKYLNGGLQARAS